MKTTKRFPGFLPPPLLFILAVLTLAGVVLAGNQACRQPPGVVITGQAVTPAILSTPNATEQAAAERATIEAIQTTAEAMAQGDGWDTVAQATAERVHIEQTIDAIKSQIAAVGQMRTGQASPAGTPVPTSEWRGFSEKPLAWQVVEVVIVARYVYDPERDVWIALEDDPQWQGWRPAQQ